MWMNIKLSVCALLGIVLLNACMSPVPTPPIVVSTSITTDMPEPTITPTPRQSAIVKNSTTLYQGPGNINYEVLAEIPAGEIVYPTGTFGDFIQIEYQEQIGFILKTAFEQLPKQLGELLESNVPPQSENLLELIYDSETTWSDGYATIDLLNEDEWWGYDVGPMTITKPFIVEINMMQKGQYGAIVLSGRIPAPGKPWWEGRQTLYIRASGSIEIRDGQSENSIYRQNINGLQGQPFTVIFPDLHGKSMIFKSQSGKELANIDLSSLHEMNFSNGLFPDGLLYFGALVAPASSLTIKHLELFHAPNGYFQEQEQVMTLRDLANQTDIMIGTTMGWQALYNTSHRNKIISEFNGATVGFSWAEIEPERGKYDFSESDLYVEFATRNNMKITGLHLLWGSRDFLPPWLIESNFTKEEYMEILHEYIVTLANHYKGKIYIWSIANEFTTRKLWGGDFWYDRLGSEYVGLAFKWTHETDPNALLMLNESCNESMKSRDAVVVRNMLSFVEQMKNDNVPIDVIGMQMHLLSPFSENKVPTKQDVIETMLLFHDLGFPIYITEFDVNLHNVQGNQQEKWEYQAKVYKEMFEACLESGVCKGFSIFGLADGTSWYGDCDLCLNIPDADPLIFDKNLNPKPAYFSLLEFIQ